VARNFSDPLNTYLAGNTFTAVLLLKIDAPDFSDSGGATQTLYYTDNPYDLTFDGDTYSAQGQFINITESSINAEVQISSVNISISALTTSNVTTFASSEMINKNVSIYRGFIDPSTNVLFGDSAGENAFLIFKGKVAGYSVNNQQTYADITLQVSSQFVNFNRKNGRRTNLNNFQREHPNDYGMEFSHEALSEIKWGLK
jgi:hypothetical protein